MSIVMTNRLVAGAQKGQMQALALGTSTTETAFSVNGVILGANTPIAAVGAALPVSNQGQVTMYWDGGRPFDIVIWGNCVTGTNANLTLKLYQVPASILAAGTQATVANDNLIASSSARAVNTTTGKFWFEARNMQWDSTTKLLHGQFSTEISNLVDSWAATTAVTTATAFDTELNFIFSATLSSGNAANVVNAVEFVIAPHV